MFDIEKVITNLICMQRAAILWIKMLMQIYFVSDQQSVVFLSAPKTNINITPLMQYCLESEIFEWRAIAELIAEHYGVDAAEQNITAVRYSSQDRATTIFKFDGWDECYTKADKKKKMMFGVFPLVSIMRRKDQ